MIDQEKTNAMVSKIMDEYNVQPLFYTISGSHIYGFNDSDSDIDIRGVHMNDTESYLKLSGPINDIIVNQNGIRDGYEEFEIMDFSSWSLRKYGEQLLKGNFNPFEWIYSGMKVVNNIEEHTNKLRGITHDVLLYTLPKSYYGMAKGNYKKYIERPKSDSYNPIPKKYLYVIRGYLGAIYSSELQDIEASPFIMSQRLGDVKTRNHIIKLIELKKGNQKVPNELKDEIELNIEKLERIAKDKKVKSSLTFEEKIDNWILNIREELKDEDV